MASTDQTVTAIADANGDATATITPYRRQVWRVDQVSIEAATGPGTAIAALYKGDFLITPMVAQADAADGAPPIILRPGERMHVRWSGLHPGDQARAIFIYDDGVP